MHWPMSFSQQLRRISSINWASSYILILKANICVYYQITDKSTRKWGWGMWVSLASRLEHKTLRFLVGCKLPATDVAEAWNKGKDV